MEGPQLLNLSSPVQVSRDVIPLFEAARTGNRSIFNRYLQNNTEQDLDICDENGTHILVCVAQKGMSDVLLTHASHLDVNVCDKHGQTPLMFECMGKNVNLTAIHMLLEKGAKVLQKDHGFFSAPHYALMTYNPRDCRKVEQVDMLLKACTSDDLKKDVLRKLLQKRKVDVCAVLPFIKIQHTWFLLLTSITNQNNLTHVAVVKAPRSSNGDMVLNLGQDITALPWNSEYVVKKEIVDKDFLEKLDMVMSAMFIPVNSSSRLQWILKKHRQSGKYFVSCSVHPNGIVYGFFLSPTQTNISHFSLAKQNDLTDVVGVEGRRLHGSEIERLQKVMNNGLFGYRKYLLTNDPATYRYRNQDPEDVIYLDKI